MLPESVSFSDVASSNKLFVQLLSGPQPKHRALRGRGELGAWPIQATRSTGDNSSRIIIPGSSDFSQRDRRPEKIVMPGQDRGSKASIDTNGIPLPSTSKFRPPPGFMDATPGVEASQPLDQAEAINALERLRSSVGAWYELARLLPRLAAAGYDSTVVEMESGIERALQNVWAVASQVYDSLEKTDSIEPSVLRYFGDDSVGADMLYHLRFLPVAARPAVAAYIVDRQLNATESGVLARAVKEQERREGHKEGFTASPADCLAYKYYRDAIETRQEHIKERLIKKGLATAESTTATSALEQLLGEKAESVAGIQEAPEANLEIIRLTGEEVEFRPLPLAGEMAEVSAASVASAIGVKQGGPYNAFSIPAEVSGQQFVALPAFRSLLLARSPVALSIADCSAVPEVLKAARATKEEDIARQAGPGLLLLERNVEEAEHDAAAFYVLERDGQCQLREGGKVEPGEQALGKILFLCRPPVRNAAARLDSYALMSV